jgi:hypothetical protein
MWSEDESAIGEATAVERAFEGYEDEPYSMDAIEIDLGFMTIQVWSERDL